MRLVDQQNQQNERLNEEIRNVLNLTAFEERVRIQVIQATENKQELVRESDIKKAHIYRQKKNVNSNC